MEPSALYEAPFSSVHAGGPEALFAGKSNVIEGIFEKLKTLQPRDPGRGRLKAPVSGVTESPRIGLTSVCLARGGESFVSVAVVSRADLDDECREG